MEEFRDEQRMPEALSRLHDAHDGRVDLVLSILEDALGRLLIVCLRLAHLDRVDLDTEERMLEATVEMETVALVNLATLWLLSEHAYLGGAVRGGRLGGAVRGAQRAQPCAGVRGAQQSPAASQSVGLRQLGRRPAMRRRPRPAYPSHHSSSPGYEEGNEPVLCAFFLSPPALALHTHLTIRLRLAIESGNEETIQRRIRRASD